MTTADLEELREVQTADVYKAGRPAARLERMRDSVRFAYLPSYAAAGFPPVATTLPIGAEVRTHSAGAVPAFFAGLLPEGRRLTALRRAVKTSADDDLSLLLAVGADTVGDVQVLPAGTAVSEVTSRIEVAAWERVDFGELFTQATGARLDRVGLPGVQEKVSARMIGFPVAQAGDRYFLKLDPPEFPYLVENEAFFLEAARRSGLRVAEAHVVRDSKGSAGLLVRRFDRASTGGVVVAVAQEDGCQVLGRYPADRYNLSYEEVLSGLAGLCRARTPAALDLLRQVAFAYVTCNGDAHAKNFSVYRPGSEWVPSPAYDLPSSYPYDDVSMALPLAGLRREDIGREHFLSAGEALGVRPRAVGMMLDQLVARYDEWGPGLAGLPFDQRRVHKLRRAIEYRLGRIIHR